MMILVLFIVNKLIKNLDNDDNKAIRNLLIVNKLKV